MLNEQRELEFFMRQEARKAAGKNAKKTLKHAGRGTMAVLPMVKGSARNSPQGEREIIIKAT
jgi:hypothetical protein